MRSESDGEGKNRTWWGGFAGALAGGGAGYALMSGASIPEALLLYAPPYFLLALVLYLLTRGSKAAFARVRHV